MGLTVEQQVLKFLQDANRPYNVQLVVDMLQKFGIKKGQVTKALDCLVEKGVISVKVCVALL
jgi:DNA-binding MarR family transcriptional regulator